MDERESTEIKLEQLSSEEIYVRIKKKGEWIIEKNKPDNKYALERFYPDEWPFKETDEKREEDFDIFFADADGNQKLFKNNFWFHFFIEFSEAEKKSGLRGSIPDEEKEKIIDDINKKMGTVFLNQLRSLARERFDLNQAKKYDEVDEINEKFEPLLEQAYLILREAGIKPGDIRR